MGYEDTLQKRQTLEELLQEFIKMKVAIHQPNFLPYLGYFNKIRQADRFVFLDDVQFSKRGFTNRNRIKTPNGIRWLTVPLSHRKGKISINKIIIQNLWIKKFKNVIDANYRNAEYYDLISTGLNDIFDSNWLYLVDLNKSLIYFVMKLLDIDTKVTVSSSLRLKTTSTQRLIDICKAAGGTQYLSGPSGHKYMDEKLFTESGIELLVHKFEHPTYKQLHGEFVPNLSVLDYLMNEGPKQFWGK